MNNVTVVIPVYKDWHTLSKCIESLKKHLHRGHKVVLVNDRGPDWEKLEKNILDSIRGYDYFEYRKNESNMGFVKTCNKAVLEWEKSENDILLLNSDTEVTEGFLEEMQRILYMDERTGVVCPRSNNAAFLSVPVNNNGKCVSAEDSFKIYMQVKIFLPEREECWTGVGFAFLIKRQVIREVGLFDEIFGRGYNEENDFCMRIRKQGYRVMKANHAYVFHMGRVSFQNETDELDLRNGSLLLRRYPDYWDRVRECERKIDVVDYYADVLTDVIYRKKRVLIALLEDMDRECLLETIRQCRGSVELNQCDCRIVLSKENRKKVCGFVRKIKIYHTGNLKGTFHVAYSLSEPDAEGRTFLNRHSPVTIVCRDFKDINVERDIESRSGLDDLRVDGLRKMWEACLKREEEDLGRGGNGEKCIRIVKNYLYAHQIWTYVLWRRVKNRLRRRDINL